MCEPAMEEYEQRFERGLFEQREREQVKGERMLRQRAYEGLLEREERLKRGVSAEELARQEEFERSQRREALNRRAIAKGSLVGLVEAERMETEAQRVRREVEEKYSLNKALQRNPLPVFLVAQTGARNARLNDFFMAEAVSKRLSSAIAAKKGEAAKSALLNSIFTRAFAEAKLGRGDFKMGRKTGNPYALFTPAATVRLVTVLNAA